MRCISTLAVMNNGDHELAAARHRLGEQLAEIRSGAGLGEDESPDLKSVWGEAGWVYVCSVPRREEDGAIGYVHLFRHRWATAEGRFLSLAVVASPGWWPVGCGSLAPRRSQTRGVLRLVS